MSLLNASFARTAIRTAITTLVNGGFSQRLRRGQRPDKAEGRCKWQVGEG